MEDDALGDAGSARDGGNESNIILSTAIVKRIDAAWAEGTGNGGLDSGSVAASTVYHVWLIKSTANNTTDVLLSTSSSSPTLPTSPVVYDLKRRIGAVVTDSSSNITGSLTQVHAGGQESYESEQLTIAAGTLESPLHGLSAVPKSFRAYLHCKVATWGFAAGDRVEIAAVQAGGSNDSGRGVTVIPFASSISARFGLNDPPLSLIRQDGGAVADVPAANFDLVLRATLY